MSSVSKGEWDEGGTVVKLDRPAQITQRDQAPHDIPSCRAPHFSTTAPRMRLCVSLLLVGVLSSLGPSSLSAQALAHTRGAADARLPTEGGQSAFAAIAEIVKLLEADPTTDWSKVNLERLRLHLRDMDLVTLRSSVTATPVDGGATFVVRGTGDVVGAIKRLTGAHVSMVEMMGGPWITRTELPDGVRLVVTVRDAKDVAGVARIRGLGFVGLMASGDHHQMHHLMLARGEAMADHGNR